MSDLENIYLYFEDLAVRNLDIAHDRSKTLLKDKRFFQMESVQMIQSAQQDLVNWTLILEGHEGAFTDNKGDFLTILDNIAFMVLKHCKPDDLAARRATYNKAFEIGQELCRKIRTDCAMPCNAALHGAVQPPFSMQIPKVKFHQVGPPFFINAIGYRFTLDLHSAAEVTMELDPAKWNLL